MPSETDVDLIRNCAATCQDRGLNGTARRLYALADLFASELDTNNDDETTPPWARTLITKIDTLTKEIQTVTDDQQHLDNDVNALNDGIAAIEAEIAALKNQPVAASLDFTRLDAAVARVTGDGTDTAQAPATTGIGADNAAAPAAADNAAASNTATDATAADTTITTDTATGGDIAAPTDGAPVPAPNAE